MHIIEFCDTTINPRGYVRVDRARIERDLDAPRLRRLRAGDVVTGDSGIRYRRQNLPTHHGANNV